MSLDRESRRLEATMERSSRTLKLKDFLRRRASSMSSLLPTHLNKMVQWRGRIEIYLTWRGPCLMNTRFRTGFGRKQSTPLATPSTVYTFTESSRKHHMNSSPVKSPFFSYFRVFGSKCFILIKRGRNSKFAPKAVEGFYLVMTQTQGNIESSTSPLDQLKFLVTLCYMKLMAPKWSKLILMNQMMNRLHVLH